MTLLVALAPVIAFGVLLGLVTVPYVSLGPGPTFDTLGEVDGKEVVDIQGTQVHPASGHLNMTTVAQRDNLTLGEALALWMSGREQLVPRDLVYPPDKSRDEVDKNNNDGLRAVRGQCPVRGARLPEVRPGADGRGGQQGRTVGRQAAGRRRDRQGRRHHDHQRRPVSVAAQTDQAGTEHSRRIPPEERPTRNEKDHARPATKTAATAFSG